MALTPSTPFPEHGVGPHEVRGRPKAEDPSGFTDALRRQMVSVARRQVGGVDGPGGDSQDPMRAACMRAPRSSAEGGASRSGSRSWSPSTIGRQSLRRRLIHGSWRMILAAV